ncbi:MAG: hypothetical protein Q8K71_03850 [Polaromonas sp.]|nr:hypothetical protein [Polaromonas sp.]MDP3750483.1 hypothetical protein [Polaromonas sp.]
MNELLNNPAVQAGVAPFVVALVAAVLLHRTKLLGLAIGAGFLTVVYLALGFSFDSLTSVRKMILCGGIATALVLVIEAASLAAQPAIRAALALAAAVAAIWVVSRLLQQLEWMPALLAGAGAVIYMMALVESGNRLGNDSVRAASAALVLGLCSGVLALLSASASLAQVGIAVGAGAGAALLIQMMTGKYAPTGWTLALPATVVAGLVGLLSVFTGALPWYCLLPTLAVPWATRLVPAGKKPVWLAAFLCALAALVPMLLAVTLAWFTAGSSST